MAHSHCGMLYSWKDRSLVMLSDINQVFSRKDLLSSAVNGRRTIRWLVLAI